jgi:hypothetical protein
MGDGRLRERGCFVLFCFVGEIVCTDVCRRTTYEKLELLKVCPRLGLDCESPLGFDTPDLKSYELDA